MNVRDLVELNTLTEYGNPDIAEAAGIAVTEIIRNTCQMLGLDADDVLSRDAYETDVEL